MARRGKSGRRANGEGTVYIRRDGRPEARYTVATPSGSKRKTITGRKGQTKEDLATEMRRRLVAAEGRVFTDEENLALGDYIDRWLRDSVRDTVRQRTYERYEQMVRVHVKPALGHVKLTKLHPGLIRGLYRERLDSGLAPRTVQYIHVTLRKALAQAVSDGLVARNATDGVKAPRPRKKEMNPLSGDQARAFLAAAREGSDRFEALYVLAVHTGMRRGELLGLQWDDVDLAAGTLQVRRSLAEARTGFRYEPPKNGRGRRILLSATATAALKRHRKLQIEERLRAAGAMEDHGLIFCNELGRPKNASALISRGFLPLLWRAGLPRIRFHDLRHTCATLLLMRGVHPKIVQELLGHSSISITLDTYSHVLEGMGEVAPQAMDDELGAGQGPLDNTPEIAPHDASGGEDPDFTSGAQH